MKENDNPVIYHVAENDAMKISSPNQVASKYLEPFLSREIHPSKHYSWQVISSYHNAMQYIDELDRNNQSTTRNPCQLLKAYQHESDENVSTIKSTMESHMSSTRNTLNRYEYIRTADTIRGMSGVGHEKKKWEPQLVFSSLNTSPTMTSVSSPWKRDPMTCMEVFNIIRSIQDPEHPLTLEQLNVVNIDSVRIAHADDDLHSDSLDGNQVHSTLSKQDSSSIITGVPSIYIRFTPTIPHCSMATLIGLCIKVKLIRSLKPNYWNIDVRIKEGTHVSEIAINRQLNDKERVKASLENDHLLNVVNKCVRGIVPS